MSLFIMWSRCSSPHSEWHAPETRSVWLRPWPSNVPDQLRSALIPPQRKPIEPKPPLARVKAIALLGLNLSELVMRFRFVLAALLLTVLVATSTPLAAEKVLRIGSTPTGVPFTFLDT